MTVSPSLELQGAIVARLKASSPVTAICGTRVYDNVPRADGGAITAQYPFVAFASDDALTDDAECIRGENISINIDCWSRGIGFAEVKRLSEAVKQALHDDDTLTLTTNALVLLEHQQTRTFRDEDGLTSHAVLTFEAFVEQP